MDCSRGKKTWEQLQEEGEGEKAANVQVTNVDDNDDCACDEDDCDDNEDDCDDNEDD